MPWGMLHELCVEFNAEFKIDIKKKFEKINTKILNKFVQYFSRSLYIILFRIFDTKKKIYRLRHKVDLISNFFYFK